MNQQARMHLLSVARKALEDRMAEIGKGMDEIMPQDARELVSLCVADVIAYPKTVDPKVWMTTAVSSGGPGVLRLNI